MPAIKFLKGWVLVLSIAIHIPATALANSIELVTGGVITGMTSQDQQLLSIGFTSLFSQALAAENIVASTKFFDSYTAFEEAVKTNQINSVFILPLSYVKLESYLISSVALCGVINDKTKYRTLLLVRNDSAIKNVSDLKAKKISTAGYLRQEDGAFYLKKIFAAQSLVFNKNYFSDLDDTENANQALTNLYFKKNDAVLVRESEFESAKALNAQLNDAFKVIYASEPQILFIVTATKSFGLENAETVKKALLDLDKTVKGRRILSLMRVDGFTELDAQSAESLRSFYGSVKHVE